MINTTLPHRTADVGLALFHISVSVLSTLMLCRPDSNNQNSMTMAAEQPEPERMWRKMWRQHFLAAECRFLAFETEFVFKYTEEL